uniref:protein GRINL1A n=1 Tax=Myxine glutinosa TaxID=7769 RepID=UPI00358F3F97
MTYSMAVKGNVGKQELLERLRRQERLLANRKFLKTLPDGGGKVEVLVHQLRMAVARLSEADDLAGVLSNAHDERSVPGQVRNVTLGCHGDEPMDGINGMSHKEARSPVVQVCLNRRIEPNAPMSPKVCVLGAGVRMPGNGRENLSDGMRLVQVTSNKVQDPCTESTNEQMSENMIIGGTRLPVPAPEPTTNGVSLTVEEEHQDFDALARDLSSIHLSNDDRRSPGSGLDNISMDDASGGSNPFLTSQKPHFLEVIENRQRNPCCTKKFKPNRSLNKNLLQSLQRVRPVPPVRQPGVQEALDQSNSAHLPPLLYAPVKFLSLQEAAALLQKQKRRQQELQMNIAAAKLSERTDIHMDPFEDNVGKNSCYRDAHWQQEDDEVEDDVEREDYN